MFGLSDCIQIERLVFYIKFLILFEGCGVFVGGIKALGDTLFDVLYYSTQVSVIVKHVHQTWTLSTRLLLYLAIDDRSIDRMDI